MANTFVGEPWRMPYSAEELQNAVANQVPRINETTKHFERWNISKGEWEDTGVKAEGEDGDVSPAQLNAAIAQVNGNIAPVESTSTASRAYAVGDLLIYEGVLREVTAAIALGDALAVGTNLSSGSVTLSEKVTPENAGTTGQVLTKTATGASWQDASLGLLPQVLVTTRAGASVTATLGSVTVGPVTADENGLATLDLTGYGEWTLTATLGGETDSDTLEVTGVMQYAVKLSFSPLPKGYTELEYLESTGTQYIDTTVPMSGNANFDIEMSNFVTSTQHSGAFGVDNNGQQPAVGLISATSSTTFQASGTIYTFTDVTSKQIIGYHSQKLYVNNSHVATGNIPGDYPYTIYLFSYHSASNFFGKVRIYSAIFYDSSENEIRHFIPAKRDSDDVLGMYDIVTDTFFTNQGSGSFTAGPEV